MAAAFAGLGLDRGGFVGANMPVGINPHRGDAGGVKVLFPE
jgi:hypothetical protein